MPQINQLAEIFFSQLFWLLIVFGIIYFVIGRGMVPKIQSTVDARERRIGGDLEAAQKAREAADETEAAWRSRMESARAEALRLTQQAQAESARETEAKVKAAADTIGGKVEVAEAKIRDAVQAAQVEIHSVAAEATQEMLRRLTGIEVDKNDALAAVKAELNV